MIRNSWLFIGLIAICVSCRKTTFYEKAVSFEGKEWTRNLKPSFTVDIKNIEQEYDFTLSLRTTTDYKYSNLWVFLKTIAPDGTTAREPFEIVLANPDGSWVGNKSGTIVETPLSFTKRKLPLKGKYKFIVEQGITNSEVDEVLDISFIVETSAN
jgi:gliding motility-associated lipoprotein GldH